MLTVKHIRQDGSEELYTCDSVRYIPDDASADAFRCAGLYLDPEIESPCSGVSDPGQSMTRSVMARLALPISRTGSPLDICRPEAFVMNANGATIARYAM